MNPTEQKRLGTNAEPLSRSSQNSVAEFRRRINNFLLGFSFRGISFAIGYVRGGELSGPLSQLRPGSFNVLVRPFFDASNLVSRILGRNNQLVEL